MDERWIVVTGATGGIGSAVCRRLHRAGLRPVVGHRRRPEAAQVLASETAGLALELDLEQPDTLASAIAGLADRTVAGVVLNAAPPPETVAFTEATPEQFARHWQTAIVGNHALLGALHRQCFRPRRQGAVIAVLSSAWSETGRVVPKMAPYIVSKAALKALLQALSAEARWLAVDTISPGYTDTLMLSAAYEPRMIELLREQGQVADPDVVANDIVERLLAALAPSD